MKRILAILLAASMTVGLTACGENNSTDGSSTGTNGSSATQTDAKEPAQKDKTLVIAVPANFEEKWNPLMAESAYDVQVMEQIFVAPQRVDANNEMSDWGGSISYEEQDDGSVIYTVTVNKGMTFSDGEPVTIDDYIYSLYVEADPSYTGPAALITEDIEGIEEYYYDDPNYSEKIAAIDEEAAAKYAPDVISEEDFIAFLVATNLNGWWTGDPAGDIGDGKGTTWSDYITAEGFGDDLAAIDATDPTAMLNLLAKVEYTKYADSYDPFTYYENKMKQEYIGGNLEDGIDVAEISGITRVDDYTATVKYNSVNIYGDRSINAYFVPEHYYGELTKGDVSGILSNMEPMGSGPYMWGGFSDNIATCTANVNYFEGVPNIGTVKWQYVPDADTISALASGEVDIANPSGSQDNINELEEEGLEYTLIDFAGYGYMGFNCVTLSQNVRKGLMSLMNRQPSVEGYFGELATVIERPMSSVLAEYPQDATTYYPYDPAKALEYFEADGYTKNANGDLVDKSGNKLVVSVYIGGEGVGNHPGYAMLTQAANDMAAMGAELQIQDVDFNVLQGAMNDGTADLWVMAWGAVTSCDKSTQFKSDGGQNRYGIKNDELDDLLDQILVTMDLDERKELVSKMLDLSMDLAIELPLYQRKDIIAYNEQNVDMSSIPEDTSSFWDYSDVLWTIKMN